MAGDLARRAVDDGADLVLALGGDGTINEVANGMIGSRVPLGILPAGTANVLAVEMGLGGRISKAIPRLAGSSPERISVGVLHNELGTRYFLMMAGIGLDAEIVYGINAELKKAIGKLAYWVGGFSHVVKPIPEFEAAFNGERRRAGFVLASRVRNYGGDLEIATGANLLGNDLETIAFAGSNPLRYLLYFSGVLVRQLHRVPGATVEKCRRLECAAPADKRIYVQLDGEYAGRLPATIEVLDDALTLLVPADFRERLGVTVGEAFAPAAG